MSSVAQAIPERTRSDAASRFYRPELDVLRFFAFFIVFAHHDLPLFPTERPSVWAHLLALADTTIADIGGFGMCVFFLLSSYLITELLQREKERTGSIHIPSFYLRRILRIWPLYFGFLFLMAAIGLHLPAFKLETGRLLAFLGLGGNWYMAKFGVGAIAVAPLWSISLEEQFYLVWPFLSKLGGRRGVAMISAALIPLSWLAVYLLSRAGAARDGAMWFNSFVQFQFFGLGALLALQLKGRAPRLAEVQRLGVFAGGCACWLIADGAFHVLRADLPPWPAGTVAGYVFGGIGCLLIFTSFIGSRTLANAKSLIYLGKISYGLYVFHMLAILVSRTSVRHAEEWFSWRWQRSAGSWEYWVYGLGSSLLAFAVTVVMASLSYKFFERPFLKLKERYAFVLSRRA